MRAKFKSKILTLDYTWTNRLRIVENHSILRKPAIIFAHSGDSWFCLIALVLLWFFGNTSWRSIAIAMIVGVVLSALIVFILKLTIRRPRPEGDWGTIYRKTDPHSFPSGHATRVTMLAVVAIGLGPIWFGILLSIWAPLVIFARVAMGVHYLFDVIVGAAIGLGLGLLILQIQPYLPVFG